MEARALEEEARLDQSSGSEALQHVMAAAELYFSLVQSCRPGDRRRFRDKAFALIAVAEVFKAASRWKQDRQITTREARLLLESSRLSGHEFPPWTDDPPSSEFAFAPDKDLFIDGTEFSLSPLQLDNLSSWERPSDLFADIGTHDSQLMQAETGSESDLVQDVTGDCSVVASLCSAMRLIRSRDEPILSGLMFPFDPETSAPKLSDSGKYVFRMNFNGCFRKVEIDDRLPASGTGRALFVIDRQNPGLLWPALVEKAYMKVRGGYDFPGSNSCIDLWMLTGWIPEQLFLQSRDELDLDKRWNSIVESFRLGNVIITLGTGQLSEKEEDSMGLAGTHDYGVLDIDSSPNKRQVLVKNPWSSAQPFNNSASPSRPRTGTFWMSLDDVILNFEHMYLSWNPRMFGHRQDHHFKWSLAPRPNMSATVIDNPQFLVVPEEDCHVWILLVKHFTDAKPRLGCERRSNKNSAAGDAGYISICIFDNDGKKLHKKPSSNVHKGKSVDSPQTLTKLPAKARRAYTVMPVQYDLPPSTCPFTLSFFSSCRLDVGEAKDAMQYTEERGAWTRRTAGGNTSLPSFGSNPQFSITVRSPGPLSLLLCTDNTEVRIQIGLIWAHGERVDSSPDQKDTLASSGEYIPRCTVLDISNVDAGTYTAVCSTWEPKQRADFTLRIGSRFGHTVRPALSEAAGRFRLGLTPLSFAEGETARRATLLVNRLTKFSVNALCRSPQSSNDHNRHRSTTALRILVVTGSGPNETTLAISGDGEFRKPTGSLKTSDVDIEPSRHMRDGLWVVVERAGGYSSQETFRIELLSDGHVAIGDWEVS